MIRAVALKLMVDVHLENFACDEAETRVVLYAFKAMGD